MNQPAITPPTSVPGQRVEVLKAGTWTDMHGRQVTITRDDLAEMASSYDPAVFRAPVVIGHPKLDAPAWGVHERFEVDGDSLYAVEGEVDAQFAAFRDAGRYSERSISFFPRNHPNNPTPGKLHPRHVGWLGAMPPAVTGLARLQGASPAEFAGFDVRDGIVELSMGSDMRWGMRAAARLFGRLREWVVEQVGMEKADQVIPSWDIESVHQAAIDDSPTANFSQPALATQAAPAHQGTLMTQQNQNGDQAARERALAHREEAIKAEETRLAALRADAARAEAVAFAGQLIADGRLLPRNKAQFVELWAALPPSTEPMSFAGDDGTQQSKPAVQMFRELFEGLPKHLDFAEHGASVVPGEQGAPVDFAAAPGVQVDSDRLALHAKAIQYQQQNPNATYVAAVKAVGG
ncbi:MAG: hypothetical protein JNM58_00780 [Xanthomonadaceae bacterium]|nr:hypothetical protein [Xanthomonadaceae bacterium]